MAAGKTLIKKALKCSWVIFEKKVEPGKIQQCKITQPGNFQWNYESRVKGQPGVFSKT